MRLKWFPWRFLASWLARSHGFLDPIQWLGRMRGFAHPSEVTEPVELLRAGVLFHARGLINTKAIQHNLDWVWPYWVERQFNPDDESFIPRAFSFSHINLTHRNWTAVGLPNVPFYPIVDPRGLVTPYHDAWSLDFWLVQGDRLLLLPSKADQAEQKLEIDSSLTVRTRFEKDGCVLQTRVSMEWESGAPICVIRARATGPLDAALAVSARPSNPEGVSFIDSIKVGEDSRLWVVNESAQVRFNAKPSAAFFSTYREGDVANALDGEPSSGVDCPASMATGAALFSLSELGERVLEVRIPVLDEATKKPGAIEGTPAAWAAEIGKCSRLRVPDPLVQKIYDAAVASLILHSPGSVYPGPYTYKRFWYRDAAYILNALLTLGSRGRVRKCLDRFPEGQTLRGYFRSQEGEWDSNGEVLWIIRRYLALTGQPLPREWEEPMEKGARWIIGKRLPKNGTDPHAGLLPAGFSAEHLGPNDYYYWDDFWGVAGLRAAAEALESADAEASKRFSLAAEDFLETIVNSFRFIPTRRFKGAISASPHRRMDAGAVGSLVADYPLQLFPPGDMRVMKTAEYLLAHSSHGGGFFQNMIHSGINAYLTLHLAQVLLRAGDRVHQIQRPHVARLASPTGQWPEAIHPRSGGGCMGDGQHIWAAADWGLMIRNLFVREEGGALVVGSGLFPRWLQQREILSFGPTLTPFGPVTVSLQPGPVSGFVLALDAEWRGSAPKIDIRVPGHSRVTPADLPNHFLILPDA